MAATGRGARSPGQRVSPPEGRPAGRRQPVAASRGNRFAACRILRPARGAAFLCILGGILLLAVAAPAAAPDGASTASRRAAMVRTQIAERGVADPAVLKAMGAVQRHRFVPAGQLGDAYDDRPLPIGYGQTISQPYIVAAMTESIRPRSDHKVLEVGTGSGYQAAVLAEIVAQVFTVEIIPELGKTARERLQEMGYRNVAVRVADGYDGWPEEAPFDAIVVTAAAEYIPPPLLGQLREGGRMIIPVGAPFFTQMLTLVEKRGGQTTTRQLMPVRFVPFRRAP
ncbi:MAG: protein-L-isoaspartate(D-aspartate) O-methyltransferase [Syntrophales bacterium]